MSLVDFVIAILPDGETHQQNWNKPVSTSTFSTLTPNMTRQRPPAANMTPAPRLDRDDARRSMFDDDLWSNRVTY
jgi:hypothetical protein